MNFYLLAAAASLTISSASFASDLRSTKAPAPTSMTTSKPHDWSGPYIGLNGGFGRSNSDITNVAFANPYPGVFFYPPGEDGKFQMKGGLVGGQIGYNYQSGQIVFGLEADLDFANMKGPYEFPGPNPVTLEGELQSLGTVRARFGYTLDHVLLFATGGLAYGSTQALLTTRPDPTSYTSTGSKSYKGYAVGGGAEYALTQNWVAKAEYLYVDLGTQSNTYIFTTGNEAAAAATSLTSNIVRVGLNYKF